MAMGAWSGAYADGSQLGSLADECDQPSVEGCRVASRGRRAVAVTECVSRPVFRYRQEIVFVTFKGIPEHVLVVCR